MNLLREKIFRESNLEVSLIGKLSCLSRFLQERLDAWCNLQDLHQISLSRIGKNKNTFELDGSLKTCYVEVNM